jgi:hypothetical protein
MIQTCLHSVARSLAVPLIGIACVSAVAAVAVYAPSALAQTTEKPAVKPAKGKSAAKPADADAKSTDAKSTDPKSTDPKSTDPKSGTKASAGASPSGANQALLLASYADWGAYASQQGKAKVCYALSQPKDRLPKNLNRDPAYLFVSSRPTEGVRNEVSLVLGFAAKDGTDAQAVIGPTAFALITKASNAWVKNPAEEGQVLAALAKGEKVMVKAESKRGNKLSDEYSLKGFAQALDRVKKECP